MSISYGDEGVSAFKNRNWSEKCLDLTRLCAILGAGSVSVSTAACSVAMGGMLISWLVSGKALEILGCAIRQRVGQALCAFMLLLVIDTIYSEASLSQSLDSLWSWRKLFYGFILLGLFSEMRWKKRFIEFFVLISLIGLVASLVSWLGWIPAFPFDYPGVVFTNHTTQGMTFAVAALCCLAWGGEIQTDQRRWGYALAALFALNIIFTSMARSAYIGLLVVFWVWFARRYGKKNYIRVAIAIGVGVILVFSLSSGLRQRVNQVAEEARAYQTDRESAAGARVNYYKNTLQMIAERPWFGFGTGSFGKEYKDHFEALAQGCPNCLTKDPHNQYLFILTENGIVGLLVFLLFLGVSFRQSRQPGPYTGILQGVLCVWCLTSLFSSHFRTFPESHVFWLFWGAMLAPVVLDRPVIETSPVALSQHQ